MADIAWWIIGIGLTFDVLGCLGLIRLPDVYNRAQAATKCVTLGTCMLLAGVALLALATPDWPVSMAVKAVICAVFILLTSPVAAHAICRGAYLSGVPLWPRSVEDAFADRAAVVRRQTMQGTVKDEKAQAP